MRSALDLTKRRSAVTSVRPALGQLQLSSLNASLALDEHRPPSHADRHARGVPNPPTNRTDRQPSGLWPSPIALMH